MSRVSSLGKIRWVKRQKSLDMRRNYTAKAREKEQHNKYESWLEISIYGKKTKRGINGESMMSERWEGKKKIFKKKPQNAGRQNHRNAKAEHEPKRHIPTPPKACACFALACFQTHVCMSGRQGTPSCEGKALGICGKTVFLGERGVCVCTCEV